MFRRLQLGFGALQVSGSPFRRFVDVPRQVELEVREFASTVSGARALANLLNAWVESGDRIAEKAMRALACGELEYVAWHPSAGSAKGSSAPTDLTALLPEDDNEDEVPLHAVVLELVNALDEPIAGAAYRLLDPAGRTHSGSLDHDGRAEIREIRKAGTCKVSFPEFDSEAWSYVHAEPL
ncbi:MAG: hypothetical protein ACRBN8_06100 [Nannocystales bacterium]